MRAKDALFERADCGLALLGDVRRMHEPRSANQGLAQELRACLKQAQIGDRGEAELRNPQRLDL
jgi:hypothetical protein